MKIVLRSKEEVAAERDAHAVVDARNEPVVDDDDRASEADTEVTGLVERTTEADETMWLRFEAVVGVIAGVLDDRLVRARRR
jgi:hypothetical protein